MTKENNKTIPFPKRPTPIERRERLERQREILKAVSSLGLSERQSSIIGVILTAESLDRDEVARRLNPKLSPTEAAFHFGQSLSRLQERLGATGLNIYEEYREGKSPMLKILPEEEVNKKKQKERKKSN